MAIREVVANLFTPKERLSSIYDINFDYLRKKGVKGLIIDIDNTVLLPQTSALSLKCLQWFERMKGFGFSACLISNDLSAKRVAQIGEILKLPVLHFAMRPLPWAIEHAARDILGLSRIEIAVVGDTLFTDILPGNMLAAHTILVEPIAEEQDPMGNWIIRQVGNAVARVITGKH